MLYHNHELTKYSVWKVALVVAVIAIAQIGCGRSTSLGDVTATTQEIWCDNGRDDDIDGWRDCRDPDCLYAENCLAGGENCGNELDDDGDGDVDCYDDDCIAHELCRSDVEICDNGRDDDGDSIVDCSDPDCATNSVCISGQEICDNGIDDDDDSAIDCNDPDCVDFSTCLAGGENCGNRIDDDEDGLIDCADGDCFNHILCTTEPEDCTNGIDDDRDGRVDCLDLDCSGHEGCAVITENCTNARDDDADGKIDCDDDDCSDLPICAAQTENCSNEKDDDADGLTDCDDPDCYRHPSCKEQPGSEICNNKLDDDEDGMVDCDDSDCSSLPICIAGDEICDNYSDDDNDGATDCADPDCADDPACEETTCKPTVDFGVIQPRGANVQRDVDTRQTLDLYDSQCVIPGGGEAIAKFEITEATDVRLDYDQLSGDHVFGLYRAGTGESCNANPVRCLDPNSQKEGSFGLPNLSAGTYYLFTEAYSAGLEGVVSVTLITSSATVDEICNNGVDDDGDSLFDCADLDCALNPLCESLNCNFDENIGTLVIDGDSKGITVRTKNAGDDIQEVCAGDGGGDRVIRFVMAQSGGLAVTIEQTSWHVYGLHQDSGPGTTCTADRGTCFDSSDRTGKIVVGFDSLEKGVYYFGVEAHDADSEGVVRLRFQAYANRGPELCANKIDDDGDGLADCLDPDCIGTSGCQGPVCIPDYKAGVLSVSGSSVQVQINTASARDTQTVNCALGGGKDEVLEFQLTEVAGLHVQCSQTGDHVFGLYKAGSARDACDETQVNCGDPSTGPIACDFVFPNLQPGKYYLVAEAFKAGDEGTIDLIVSAVPDYAQELCQNGIDDDGDGDIDCRDSNCAGMPECEQERCTPAESVGLLQKDGPTHDVALSTSDAEDLISTTCLTAIGGGDAVVSFTLPQTATVAVDYVQFGNHVFALYENEGDSFPCDSAPVTCQASNGVSIGSVSFSNVKSGQYYLVVDAADAISTGALGLQISAH